MAKNYEIGEKYKIYDKINIGAKNLLQAKGQ